MKFNILHYSALVWNVFVHEPPYQTVVVCCNSIFASVLCSWTTVPFSALEWGLLRVTPMNLTKRMVWTNTQDSECSYAILTDLTKSIEEYDKSLFISL